MVVELPSPQVITAVCSSPRPRSANEPRTVTVPFSSMLVAVRLRYSVASKRYTRPASTAVLSSNGAPMRRSSSRNPKLAPNESPLTGVGFWNEVKSVPKLAPIGAARSNRNTEPESAIVASSDGAATRRRLPVALSAAPNSPVPELGFRRVASKVVNRAGSGSRSNT